jgi:hypothetical protein
VTAGPASGPASHNASHNAWSREERGPTRWITCRATSAGYPPQITIDISRMLSIRTKVASSALLLGIVQLGGWQGCNGQLADPSVKPVAVGADPAPIGDVPVSVTDTYEEYEYEAYEALRGVRGI